MGDPDIVEHGQILEEADILKGPRDAECVMRFGASAHDLACRQKAMLPSVGR